MSRYRIGALRHRVELQTPTATPGTGGGAVVQWQTVASLWASVAAVGGREDVHAAAPRGRASFDITIRHRADVGSESRFVHGGEIFDVRSALDPDGRRRWLVCRCEREEL